FCRTESTARVAPESTCVPPTLLIVPILFVPAVTRNSAFAPVVIDARSVPSSNGSTLPPARIVDPALVTATTAPGPTFTVPDVIAYCNVPPVTDVFPWYVGPARMTIVPAADFTRMPPVMTASTVSVANGSTATTPIGESVIPRLDARVNVFIARTAPP